MTDKQRLFAEQYLIDFNSIRAYMAAYPNCKNFDAAINGAAKILDKSDVQKFIAESLKSKSNSKCIAKEDEVMAYLTSVMRGEEKDEIAIRTGRDCQEIAQIKPDTKDRMKAAELLAKRYCSFDEKDNSSSNPVIIRDDLDEG